MHRPGRLLPLLFAALCPAPAALSAQGAPVAPLAELRLWPRGAPGALGLDTLDQPAVVPYLPAAGTATGAAVVIFPGGGYSHIAVAKEGVPAARWLASLGVASFIVRYRLAPAYHHEAMMADAVRAVRLVRAHAADWGLDTARIGVLGFSAGGHMASTAGTHFDAGTVGAADPVERVSSRPGFMMLLYPVVTMQRPLAHPGSRTRLLGADSADAALERRFSNEMQVTRETPPTFIVTITNDRVVPVGNSIRLYDALHAAGVPVEMHVFEAGQHGFGVAADDPVLSAWPTLAAAWMRRHGWLDRLPTAAR